MSVIVRYAAQDWKKGRSVIAGVRGADLTLAGVVRSVTVILVSVVRIAAIILALAGAHVRNAGRIRVRNVPNADAIIVSEVVKAAAAEM